MLNHIRNCNHNRDANKAINPIQLTTKDVADDTLLPGVGGGVDGVDDGPGLADHRYVVWVSLLEWLIWVRWKVVRKEGGGLDCPNRTINPIKLTTKDVADETSV
ncbi:hypothetical protein JTE90_029112 [Oedothorax gibbosus]|uniref:Uncharacterized protein n=1 Tax=Oedothorax gibbosus TaxID=931172 RepID=A0AAV6V949_9ARAC|nr:hypothetical protein JTE90_029112 [Oedothorax gibbosus]